MKEIARVIETLDSGKAIVEVERSTACENCSSKCMVADHTLSVRAEAGNAKGVKPGDIVEVEMDLSNALYASFILYGIPFLAFFIGALLGYYSLYRYIGLSQDLSGFVVSLVFVFLSWYAVRFADRRGAFKGKAQITIVSVKN